MACMLTLDNGKEMYTVTGETGYFRIQSADLFQQGCTVADFLSKTEPNACGGFIRN